MGANVGPWTQQYYGQRLTNEQFLANPAAQDAVFNGEFGADVSKYGASGAASKWFTGSPTTAGRVDANGMTDNTYVNQFNQNLAKLSQTSDSAATNLGGLGDQTKTVTGSLETLLSGSGGSGGVNMLASSANRYPVAPTGPGYFPPAPGASQSFGSALSGVPIVSMVSRLFGFGAPSVGSGVVGFADGTEFAPGGSAWVGERGPEIVNLPRGSRVVPAHRTAEETAPAGRPSIHRHEYNIVVSGAGDKELEARMRSATEQTIKASLQSYDRDYLPGRLEEFQRDRFAKG